MSGEKIAVETALLTPQAIDRENMDTLRHRLDAVFEQLAFMVFTILRPAIY